jgi:hypothetical protein
MARAGRFTGLRAPGSQSCVQDRFAANFLAANGLAATLCRWS